MVDYLYSKLAKMEIRANTDDHFSLNIGSARLAWRDSVWRTDEMVLWHVNGPMRVVIML